MATRTRWPSHCSLELIEDLACTICRVVPSLSVYHILSPLATETHTHPLLPTKSPQPPISINKLRMLASIAFSALLAGPAVAGLIPRQNTLTTTHTSTVVSTSTHFVYAPENKTTILPFLPSGTASSANGAITLAPGINPINGLPAAPPVRPSNETDIPKSSTTIRPIVMSTINGTLKAIYKSGPASTFAVPPSSSSTSTITSTSTVSRTSTITNIASSTSTPPISFRTYTPTPGVKVTVTNKPDSSSSSLTSAPPNYSALSQGPPQLPTTSSAASSAPPAKETSSAAPLPSSSKKTQTVTAAPTTATTTVLSKSTSSTPSSSSSTTSSASSSTTKPTIVITPVPAPTIESATSTPEPTTESTTSAAPAPEPTEGEDEDPYPYPTPEDEEPEESADPTTWNYPYPTA